MLVLKRDGTEQMVNKEKIKKRLIPLASDLDKSFVNLDLVVDKVASYICNKITTEQLDQLSAETCAYMNIIHPDYSTLAARICASNLHKMTSNSFFQVMTNLRYAQNKQGQSINLIALDVYEIIKENSKRLDEAIDYNRDFTFNFFGYKTLEKSYLMKINGRVVERPQQMFMRVAVGIHKEDIDSAIKTYELMSTKMFTHASPTLFNSGCPRNQMSSCFLMQIKEDSIEGIYDTLKDCAVISKNAGGIGMSISNVRAAGSYVYGSNGTANGIVPMLRVFNDTARYVDQGGGKRKGSICAYIEPWHADIFEFVILRKNTGKEEERTRDLFLALWIPDLFMQRVENNQNWTLMCPNECPGLTEVYGEEFNRLYEKYEQEGRGKRIIRAQSLWQTIVECQIETGVPFMLYKDSCNRKSNHNHLGTLKGSNLCCEIMQYQSVDEIAVCNLASICLPNFVDKEQNFQFYNLFLVAKQVTYNLNKIIDNGYYPLPETRTSNMRHRPIGIGVQGLADTFLKMKYPYDSLQARSLNKKIFETIYFAALTASNELAKKYGTYETYPGSLASQGKLQPDLWPNTEYSGLWKWEKLRKNIKQYGLRNSLLVAPMPTASTSQIMGNNESFEPYNSNIYVRRVLSGEFTCLNPHLVKDLISANLWTNQIKNQLIQSNGSLQNIPEVPSEIKEIYKTVWEIPQKTIIDMSIDRAPFIDQSQSLNIHIQQPNLGKITSMHFYAWKQGLKTGMYYLRSRPAADAIKFTLDIEILLQKSGFQLEKSNKVEELVEEEAECVMCSG